jgi:hypothetical protein
VGVAAPTNIPTSANAPAGPAIDITAKDAAGNVIHTLSAPITITIGYDPSITDTSKLVISFFDTTTNSWVALPTTVDPVAHTLTAVVTHLTLFQAQTLAAGATVAPQVTFARPVSKITGRTAQGTVVGGRTTACPAVSTLLGDIATNIATPGKDKFDAPAYPAGCVWVPVQVVSPDLASQYSGATTVVTETFPDSSSVVITNTMDFRGHSISVFPVPYVPPAGAKHGDPSTIATLDGVVIPQVGAVPPPLHERFVVIAP